MIPVMSKKKRWGRPSIELPPGWHALLVELSDATDVSLKYLYTLAVDQLLAKINIERIARKGWIIRQETGQNLERVGARYTAETRRKLQVYIDAQRDKGKQNREDG